MTNINAEHCYICGAIIPEGRQLCPNCEPDAQWELFYDENEKAWKRMYKCEIYFATEKERDEFQNVLITPGDNLTATANRLEALLSENKHLREVTKMVPKWVSVSERLPHFNQPYIVTACDENAPAGEGIWYSTVVVVAEYYNGCWTWDDSGTEYDLTGLVTHWMPLPEPPSTEGVE